MSTELFHTFKPGAAEHLPKQSIPLENEYHIQSTTSFYGAPSDKTSRSPPGKPESEEEETLSLACTKGPLEARQRALSQY